VLRQTALMVIPGALLMAVTAPLVLRLFGDAYADHAAGTLALLALSAIPNIVPTLYVRIYRVQQRMGAVVATLAAQCGIVLALGPVLLSAMGLAGVGLAWIAGQAIVAVALVVLDPASLGLRTCLKTPARPDAAHPRRQAPPEPSEVPPVFPSDSCGPWHPRLDHPGQTAGSETGS
jgi:hypothetical protein